MEIPKNIVYADDELEFQIDGKDPKVTKITYLDETSFNDCVSKIIETNPNVNFNMIQYSRKNKVAYFYGNEIANIDGWTGRREIKKVKDYRKLVLELKRLIVQDNPKNIDEISLYDVLNTIIEERDRIFEVKALFSELIGLRVHTGRTSLSASLDRFDYDTEEMTISVKDFNVEKEIVFAKENGDLYVKRSEEHDCLSYIFQELGDTVSQAIDTYSTFKDFDRQGSYNVKSTNSKFITNIDKYAVNTVWNDGDFTSDIKIKRDTNKDYYNVECNSNEVVKTITKNEDNIYKSVFVKIDDCPEWMHEKLYEKRQEQLKREERKEKLSKVFPFLKDKKKLN